MKTVFGGQGIRRAARLSCVGLLVITAGCFEDIPDSVGESGPGAAEATTGSTSVADPTTESGSTGMATTFVGSSEVGADESGEASTTTGVVEGCAPERTCLPVPERWDGPYRVHQGRGRAPPMCALRKEILLAGAPPLTAEPIDCVCEPGEPSCPLVALVTNSDFLDCGAPDKQILVSVGGAGCQEIYLSEPYLAISSMTGECGSTTAGGEPPPFQWDAQYRVCEAAEGESCDEGTCVEAQACVMREGDHACPPGEFSEQRLIYAGVQDGRDCARCTAAANCGGVEVFADSVCGGDPMATFPIDDNGACISQPETDIEPESVRWAGEFSCTVVQDTAPVGNAVPADPRTVCCRPA